MNCQIYASFYPAFPFNSTKTHRFDQHFIQAAMYSQGWVCVFKSGYTFKYVKKYKQIRISIKLVKAILNRTLGFVN